MLVTIYTQWADEGENAPTSGDPWRIHNSFALEDENDWQGEIDDLLDHGHGVCLFVHKPEQRLAPSFVAIATNKPEFFLPIKT